jgi:HD superfamily phosphodiesterase
MSRVRRAVGDPGALLALLAVGLVVACWVVVILGGVRQPGYAIVYGLLIAFGEVLRVRGGGSWHALAPLSVASGVAYGLTMVRISPMADLIPLVEVIAVMGLGQVVGALVYAAGRRDPEITCVATRTLSVAVAVSGAHAFVDVSWMRAALERTPQIWLGVALVSAVVAVSLMLSILGMLAPNRYGTPAWSRIADEFTVHGLACAATASTAAVMALGSWELGIWSGPIFVLPLLLTVVAIGHSVVVKRKQAQTIRALSRAAEVAGYTEVGHSDRVTRLSLAIGAELGLRRRRMQRLETAALMHDVGQLSLSERIPAGATLLATHEQRIEIAKSGAAVIRQTGAMTDVAEIVEEQAVPYSRSKASSAIRRDAQIVAVANAYDDLVGGEPSYQRGQQAMARINRGVSTQYDPAVVDALVRVVDSAGQD